MQKKAFASVLEEHVAQLERAKTDLENLISHLLWENEQLRQGADVSPTSLPQGVARMDRPMEIYKGHGTAG
jgi:hypothetical protein